MGVAGSGVFEKHGRNNPPAINLLRNDKKSQQVILLFSGRDNTLLYIKKRLSRKAFHVDSIRIFSMDHF